MSSRESQGSASEVSRARDLLAQAVEVLGGSRSDSSRSTDEHTPASRPPPSGVSGSTASSSSFAFSRARVSSALSERNLLFNFERKRSGRVTKGGKSKKSHDFVCLSDLNQIKTPTVHERSIHLSAGE